MLSLMQDGKKRTKADMARELGVPKQKAIDAASKLVKLRVIKTVGSQHHGRAVHGIYQIDPREVEGYLRLKAIADAPSHRAPRTGTAVHKIRMYMETVEQFTHTDVMLQAEINRTQATQLLSSLMCNGEIVRIGKTRPAKYMSTERAREAGIDVDDDEDADDEPTIPGARMVRFTSDGRFGSVAYRSMPAILCKPALGICSLEYI